MMGCNPQQTFLGSTNFFSQARTALNAESKIQALPDRNFRCRDGFQSNPKSRRINDFRIRWIRCRRKFPLPTLPSLADALCASQQSMIWASERMHCNKYPLQRNRPEGALEAFRVPRASN